MRILSATFADLDHSDLGTKSRLANELGGLPILRRTVDRVSRVAAIGKHVVLCPQGQVDRVRRITEGLAVEIVGVDGEPDPWRALTRAARKWSIDGWRGGLGGTTYFDEFCFPSLLHRLLTKHTADAVFAYPAAGPFISPALTARMIEQREKLADQSRLVFSTAVPGLAGILLETALIDELAQARSPIGSVFSYKPDSPRKDLIFHPACVELPTSLRYARGRLVADTERSLGRVSALLRGPGDDADDEAIGQWLICRDDTHVEVFPREVEIELTTASPYPQSLVRPAAGLERGPMDLAVVEKLAAELAQDDALFVLGGFGDPLRHPEFERALELLAGHRPYGLAIRTSAADLDERKVEQLVRHKVDVCCVMLDAWTRELYRELHGPQSLSLPGGGAGVRVGTPGAESAPWSACSDPQNSPPADLELVLGRLARLNEARQSNRSIVPIVVPEFCKAKENAHEMDEFFDGWLRRTGTVSIIGYSHRAGQLPDRALVDMRPPVRSPCRRIRTRCLVLADGSVTACDQDQRGLHTLGSLHEQTLQEIWQSSEYRRLRKLHVEGSWAEHPLCASCDEWHRP